jgi:hypothetical protein
MDEDVCAGTFRDMTSFGRSAGIWKAASDVLEEAETTLAPWSLQLFARLYPEFLQTIVQ